MVGRRLIYLVIEVLLCCILIHLFLFSVIIQDLLSEFHAFYIFSLFLCLWCLFLHNILLMLFLLFALATQRLSSSSVISYVVISFPRHFLCCLIYNFYNSDWEFIFRYETFEQPPYLSDFPPTDYHLDINHFENYFQVLNFRFLFY